MPVRGSRQLDPIEVRVLGSLLEKQQATPESYPLTLNSLTLACNQKTNRDPVTTLTEREVAAALVRLQDELLVWKVVGARVAHYDHNLDKRWKLEPAEKAILTLLFLRGPQTPGELRTRSERLHSFASLEAIEEQLTRMAEAPEPLVRELPRRGGQKESRWLHLAGSEFAEPAELVSPEERSAASEPLSLHVERLEGELAALRRELDELKEKLGA
jgi:uncharacterized protein